MALTLPPAPRYRRAVVRPAHGWDAASRGRGRRALRRAGRPIAHGHPQDWVLLLHRA